MRVRRYAIRQAVADRVLGLPTTGDRVYRSRVYPDTRLEEGPTLAVYAEGDAVDPDGRARGPAGEYRQDRQTEVVVEGRALIEEPEPDDAVSSDLDDLLDAMAWEVENAIMADPYLGGLVLWIEFTESTIERSDEREQPMAVQRMAFLAEYVTDATDPQ